MASHPVAPLRHRASSLATALLAALLASPALAAERPASREATLPSGLRVLLLQRPGSGTIVTAVAVQAGAQDEPPARAGLSHFLEHLLFDGFDGLDERGVTEAIERRSIYLNAFTREQATVYFALAPRDEAPAAARLLQGMLTRSALAPRLVEKERQVILEELAKDAASASSRQEEALRSALWTGTPWERAVGGTPDTVKAVTPEEVATYWRRLYRPSRMRVLVLGDAPLAELERVAAPLVALVEPKAARAPSRPALLAGAGWGTWRAAAGGGEEPKLALAVAPPAGLQTPGPVLEVLARWLGDDQGPLHAALVPARARSVSVDRAPKDPQDVLTVQVEALAGQQGTAVASALMAALERAGGEGPTDAEVARLQREAAAQRAVAGQRLHYAAVLYGDALATGRGPLLEALEPPLVEGAAVRAAARAWLVAATARTRAAWAGPGGPEAPGPLPATALGAAMAAMGGAASGPGGSRVATLRNGLQVGVLEEPGGAAFGLSVLVADRSLREPEGQAGLSDLAHRLLAEGTRLSPGERLARRLARAGLELKTADLPAIPFDDDDNVPEYGYLRLEGPATSLPEALGLLAELLREPAWEPAGFERAAAAHQQERKAMARGGAAAGLALRRRLLGAGHPLARPVGGRPEQPLPTEAQARAFLTGAWPSGYLAPSRLVVTVAGPTTAEEVAAALDDLLGEGPDSAPRRGPYPEAAPLEEPAPTADAGVAPQLTLAWGRLAEVPEAERPALALALGALSDRMVAVIREKEGLAYGLGAGARGLPGGTWLVSASVGTRPANRERVRQLFGELATRLGAEELPAADLQRLLARARQKELLGRLAAGSRAARLGRLLLEGEASPLASGHAAQTGVTPAQVRAAAARWLDPAGLTLIESR
jgi:predicted Zn-dependent peptidase